MTKAEAYSLIDVWTFELAELILKRVLYSDTLNQSNWDIRITNILLNMQGLTYGRQSKRLPEKYYRVCLNGWLENPEELKYRVGRICTRDKINAENVRDYNPEKTYNYIKALLDNLILDVINFNFRVFNNHTYCIPSPENLR